MFSVATSITVQVTLEKTDERKTKRWGTGLANVTDRNCREYRKDF